MSKNELLRTLENVDTEALSPVRYITEKAAATLIGSTPATLRRWRYEGRYLRYYKVGSSVRYKVSELEAFLAHRVVEVSGAPKGENCARQDGQGDA